MIDPGQIPLRDLHLPEPVGWWPLAPGWWVLAALALIAAAWLIRRWLRTRAQNAARRYALQQLEQLVREYEADKDPVAFTSRVSELLRRTMLAYSPRLDVAGLAGEEWLQWLDRDLAKPVFSQGPGRQLLDLPYRKPEAATALQNFEQFVAAVRHRVATPVGAHN